MLRMRFLEGNIKRYLNIKNLPFFIIIFLIIVFLSVQLFWITEDGVWYLVTARNIAHGQGYINAAGERYLFKSPLFQFILIFFFKLFGETVFSAMLAIRLFWALSFLIFFFLAKRLFNQTIALGATLLAFTSPAIYIPSFVLLKDFSFSFFLLFLLLLGILALDRKRGRPFYGLMGFVAGVGFLFKESMLSFLPIPLFVLFLEKESIKKKGLKLVWFSSILLLTIAPWLFYVALTNEGNIKPLLGQALNMRNYYFSFDEFLYSFARNFPFALGRNIFIFIHQFALGIFGLFVWCYFLYQALKTKEEKKLLLGAVFLLHLPLMLFLSHTIWNWEGEGLAFRLLLPLSFLTILLFTALTHKILVAILKKVLFPSKYYSNFFINSFFLGSISFLSILFILSSPINILSNSSVFNHSLASVFYPFSLSSPSSSQLSNLKIIGFLGERDQRIAKELKNYLPPHSKIMSCWICCNLLSFLLNDEYSWYNFPGYNIENLPSFQYKLEDLVNKTKRISKNEKLLFVWADFPRAGFLTSLTEEMLFEDLKNNSIEYVITSHPFTFLSLYFEKNPSFTEIASLENGFTKIFKVESLKPIAEFKPLFEKNAKEVILKAYEGKIYNPDRIFQYFNEAFNLDRKSLYNLVKKQSINIEFYKIY